MSKSGTENKTVAVADFLRLGMVLGNESPETFANLAEQYLEAGEIVRANSQGRLLCPIFFLAFQSLENYLKSYLLVNGVPIEDIRYKFGHKIRTLLTEAKIKGLKVNCGVRLEDTVMKVSESYTNRDFQFRTQGEFPAMLSNDLLGFVEAVCTATGNQVPDYSRQVAN
jgi:hypothetical protein